ncbi:MAG TPA: DUF418 domain-containing transporter [Enhygromyxa sp.]|nr:DUF418 domain-containing transporter [Enhygromyxa sp.]
MSDRPRKRLLGLDALRGIAVFLMIEQHLGVWLWRGPGPGGSINDYPGLLIFNALGGGAAPAFVTLAGIGASLLASKREQPDRTLVLRGLVIIGFGYLLSALTPSWFSWQSWFVLHLMGFGMLVTPLLRRVPTPALLGIGLAILLATGWVQAQIGVPIRLDNPYMSGRSPRSPDEWTALRIAVAEGQFPIFPWFSFYVAGLACGRWIAADKLRHVATLAGSVLAVGLLGVALRGLLAITPGTAIGRTTALTIPFFPASPTLAALLLGAVLLGIAAVMAWDRQRPLSDNNLLVTLGRASLTLLIVHVWLFREATRPVGMWQALGVGETFAIISGFVVFAAVGSWLWQRVDYRFGAEWLLRKLAS